MSSQPSTERFRLRARLCLACLARASDSTNVPRGHRSQRSAYGTRTYTLIPHILFLLAAPRLECSCGILNIIILYFMRAVLGCRAFQCDMYDAIRRSNYMMCGLFFIFSSKTSEPHSSSRACLQLEDQRLEGATSFKNTHAHAHIDSCGFARSPLPDDTCMHYIMRVWIYRDAIRGWRDRIRIRVRAFR
uniref:Uncharacterized protein n=1 Tax=Trichogramma kaykai TaxID=54128 RepID=A0ABD2XE58_9HYME